MTKREYDEIQDYLSCKLKNNQYNGRSWKTEEAYKEAILSIRSKIKEIYNRNNK